MSTLKLALIAALLGINSIPASVSAQATQATQSEFVCMGAAKTGRSVVSYVTMVATENKAAMSASGYSEIPCPAGIMSFQEYRAEMCKLAGEAPEPVVRQFQRDYRLNFEQLCQMAQSARQ